MAEYEFTLKFRLPDTSADPAQFVDALAAAGCDDALVGVGQRGRIALDFSREASSALKAMSSAIRSVRKAIPGAELAEAGPDFVGLSDMADLAGCSRQNMRKLALASVATFPMAVHEGSPSIWHLAAVLKWLGETKRYEIDAQALEVAESTMALNIAREARRLPGATLPASLESLFA